MNLPTFRPLFHRSIFVTLFAACLSVFSGSKIQAETSLQADVAIVGSTPAGFAAAIAAKRQGANVILLEPTNHVGGRFAEALGFDEENRMDKKAIGGLWVEFRSKINAHYGKPVGGPEPHISEAIIEKWLADEGVNVLKNFQFVKVGKAGTKINNVTAEDGRLVKAKVFIDATYMGDVLPLAEVAWTVGREAQETYQESLAGVLLDIPNPPGKIVEPIHVSHVNGIVEGKLLPMIQARLSDVKAGAGDQHLQCANLLACLTKDPANRIDFTRPTNYDSAQFELLKRQFIKSEGKLKISFGGGAIPGQKNKINDSVPVLVHWGFVGGGDVYPTATVAERRKIWEAHRDYTHSLIWFLQTDESVPESIQKNMQQWGLPKDEFVDNGHWPYDIYAREGRRLKGDYIMTQRDLFDDIDKPDSIALGCFPVDSHVVQRVATDDGKVINEGGYLVQPPLYEIPYRSLIPKAAECENLLIPVSLSCSRVAYNSLRVEPTWMALGEVTGIAAAQAATSNVPVQNVDVSALQKTLREVGVPFEN